MQYVQFNQQSSSAVSTPDNNKVNFFVDTDKKIILKDHNGGLITNIDYTELSKNEVNTLISTSGLTTNRFYKINGVSKNKENISNSVLYDDGTNSGISIYLQATSTYELNKIGYGEFYNPKYFSSDTYENLDNTGLWGIWDGENETSRITGYTTGDITFWGGYAWQNLSGNIGSSVNTITLSSEDWSKIPYSSSTYYTKVFDYVIYDYTNDWLVERHDYINDIRVNASYDYFLDNVNGSGDLAQPISLMQWGNNSTYLGYKISVDNSFVNLINFKGSELYLNTFINYSYLSQSYFGLYSHFFLNYFDNSGLLAFIDNSYVNNNIFYNTGLYGFHFINNSNFYQNNYTNTNSYAHLLNNSSINNNEILNSELGYINLNNGYINHNSINESNIENCNITGSTIYYNILSNNSQISYVDLDGEAEIYKNILDTNSHIRGINLISSSISQNKITDNSTIGNYWGGVDNILYSSSVQHNTLDNNSVISYFNCTGSSINSNIINLNSSLAYVDLINSSVDYNTLTNESYFGDEIEITSSTISNNTLIYSYYSNNTYNTNMRVNYLSNFQMYSNLFNGCNLNYNKFESGDDGYFINCLLTNNTSFENNYFINNSYISYVYFDNSEFSYNKFENYSAIQSATGEDGLGISASTVTYNTFTNNSKIRQFRIVNGSYIGNNIFDNYSEFNFNYVDGNSTISGNRLYNNSNLSFISLNSFSEISDNILNLYSSIGGEITLNNGSVIASNTLAGNNNIICNVDNGNRISNNIFDEQNISASNGNAGLVGVDCTNSSITGLRNVSTWSSPNNNLWRNISISDGSSGTYTGNSGQTPTTWFNFSTLPNFGAYAFRGGVIEYHAYFSGVDSGTIIGTINFSRDYSQFTISHSESKSGSNNVENVVLWELNPNDSSGLYVYGSESDGQTSYMIQWTAKLFYGSEYAC